MNDLSMSTILVFSDIRNVKFPYTQESLLGERSMLQYQHNILLTQYFKVLQFSNVLQYDSPYFQVPGNKIFGMLYFFMNATGV